VLYGFQQGSRLSHGGVSGKLKHLLGLLFYVEPKLGINISQWSILDKGIWCLCGVVCAREVEISKSSCPSLFRW
jgi:hypothetical protein